MLRSPASNRLLRGSVSLLLLAAFLGAVPSGARTQRASAPLVLRVALMVPRTPEVAVEEKRYNQQLAELTDNAAQVRIYWGGAAGDDRDVLRKMKAGQIDGAPLSLELLSSFVRQALIFGAPALLMNYKQVDAVRAALTPAMDAEAYENGFKVMGWGDVGRLRLLSKRPMSRIADFKTMRPWLYPESQILKEFYKIIGATGVPLGLAEVYAGLKTNMIDVIWASALLAAALQWHSGTEYISEKGLGFIGGAFVFRRPAWDGLPENVRGAMEQLAVKQRLRAQVEFRKGDERAYQKLVEHGHTPLRPANEQEWWDAGNALRKRMIGRVYTKELVEKAELLAGKYKD